MGKRGHRAESQSGTRPTLERVNDFRWRIPRRGAMGTDGLVFASADLIEAIRADRALEQVENVACLPGIVGSALAMPDIHWGYGFPIGGVAAFDPAEGGVVSPGGVGYDINCGVRLLRTDIAVDDLRARIDPLVAALFDRVPSGVGSARSDMRQSPRELDDVLVRGAEAVAQRGFGSPRDLDHVESHGCIAGADPGLVSKKALDRGVGQLGTLGSGNHFLEVGWIAQVDDEGAARALGLERGLASIIIHTGSRGLGHQVCEDSLRTMLEASRRYGIALPDPQLCCAPLESAEGRTYLAQMAAAANFAFANRQLITAFVREAFETVFQETAERLGIQVVYDVAHNIAKWEEHTVVPGEPARRLCVHRKGATRAFPAGHPETPLAYRDIGQPVLIPGDMGRCSYVLVGSPGSMIETFGSTCHGAGRLLSRGQARKSARGRDIRGELRERGIVVRAASHATLVEEIPEAYKDVKQVVEVVDRAGLSKQVAQHRPVGVVKG